MTSPGFGQTDVPTGTGTAIIPPGQSAGNYAAAEIHYLDAQGREVNVAQPGPRISVKEYDQYDNVVRELTGRESSAGAGRFAHRRRARHASARTAATDHSQMQDEKGPLHTVKLDNGQTVSARRHTPWSTMTSRRRRPAGPYDTFPRKRS